MGKHAAAEGASADPIVAAALASRPEHTGGAHSAGSQGAGESPVGWPAPPVPEGGGLGWPADARAQADASEPEPRRAWRRFFGTRRVA